MSRSRALLLLLYAYALLALPRDVGAAKVTKRAINPTNRLHTYYELKGDDEKSGVTWWEADRLAQQLGGRLVTINDAAENEWVLDTFKDSCMVWIGLYEDGAIQDWRWANGEPVGYTNFSPRATNTLGGSGHVAANTGPSRTWYVLDPAETIFCTEPIYAVVEVEPVFDFDSHLPEPSGAPNLILVTHGRNPIEDPTDFPWLDDLVNEIAAQVDLAQWEVIPYRWTREALCGRLNAGLAVKNGQMLGRLEGRILAERGYKQVHLIGHSAGAALVDAVAAEIRRRPHPKVGPADVHCTFLDVYRPFFALAMRELGAAAHWVDHYFNVGDFPRTSPFLAWAHNVDISRIRPEGQFLLGEGHAWPRAFYADTVRAPHPQAGMYGYPISREGGGYNPARYPRGIVVQLNPRPNIFAPLKAPGVNWQLFPPLNRVRHERNGGAGIRILPDRLVLNTRSPVWVDMSLTVPADASLLRATLEFTGTPETEGVLAVCLDDELIGVVPEGLCEGKEVHAFDLGDVVAGEHQLRFWLHNRTGPQTRVYITDLAFGTALLAELAEDELRVSAQPTDPTPPAPRRKPDRTRARSLRKPAPASQAGGLAPTDATASALRPSADQSYIPTVVTALASSVLVIIVVVVFLMVRDARAS